jgi:hypothetical protein
VKLGLKADFFAKGDGGGAVISRPKIVIRRDYVGESRSHMQQIRQARDFSTIVTTTTNIPGPKPSRVEQNNDSEGRCFAVFRVCADVSVDKASPPQISLLGVHEKSKTFGVQYPSSTYQQQAANLVAQIRSDMKSSKRIFF